VVALTQAPIGSVLIFLSLFWVAMDAKKREGLKNQEMD
jgi:hypothetical protein